MPVQAHSVLLALHHDQTFWSQSVGKIPGIGPARAERLAALGIRTWAQLLLHVPRHYQVFYFCPTFQRVESLAEGTGVLLAGKVVSVNVRRSKQRPHLVVESVVLSDGESKLPVVLLRPVRGWRMPPPSVNMGARIGVRAILRWRHHAPSLVQPEFLNEEPAGEDQVVPIYPLTQGLSQKLLRNSIEHVLEKTPGAPLPVPEGIGAAKDVRQALAHLHRPKKPQDPECGRRSLALLEIALLPPPTWRSAPLEPTASSFQAAPVKSLCRPFIRKLPFRPTGAQQRVMAEWDAEMEQPIGTRRLLTGDVGSGKTLIIAYALLKSVEHGGQGALIAPTRLLAAQHAKSLSQLLQSVDVKLELLTGACPIAERKRIAAALESGETDIVVGTQALLQDDVRFRRLGLGVIDEQHRFGVAQREALEAKGAERTLVVSATPIPRTMAQAVYRGLPISTLDERPPGRRPVETRWVPTHRREEVFAFLKRRAEAGEQGFVVCPYIDSDMPDGSFGAEEMFQHLQRVLGKGKVELIHGRMPPERQTQAMEAFAAGRVPVLVATSIVEVGVDVPQATVMVVESAHLFGLAQLHQLRGRVGRGEQEAYAILISDGPTPASRQRLDAIRHSSDGFDLAEQDLKLRGPGEFSGVRQWGISDLQFVDLARDLDLFALVNTWRDQGNENVDMLIHSLPTEFTDLLQRQDLQGDGDE